MSLLSGSDTIHKAITDIQADSLIKANSANPDFYIIDLRTIAEVKLGYIKKSVNIDYFDSNFNNNIDKLDKGKMYLIYCQSGGRSGSAFDLMISLKFKVVYNMLNGFKKWKNDGYPYVVDSSSTTVPKQLANNTINVYPNPANNLLISFAASAAFPPIRSSS